MVGKRTILINNKEVPIRSYEVSIWTLQDSFITVLKWANIDNKGQIQEPKMILDVDGTQNFSFSIPMYLGLGEENPAWYNTLNGNLMIGMRKIKVILNKKLEDEAIFEFLITKVTERHESNSLFCDVECEGLAFHELGKIGYKIELTPETYYLEYEELLKESESVDEEDIPQPTIDYWNKKTDFLLSYEEHSDNIIPNKWYYKVEMDWHSYNSGYSRASNKVYDDEYVSSWEAHEYDNILVPRNVQEVREKIGLVDIKESNMYNITQKIAETFGVFCKYRYGYDENYHIISREVIYYNNFIEEGAGHMDLTYPYHTSEITREMDSTELTTKLFVRPADYQTAESDQTTIMTVDANKSREDYILNFDYLHKFNIITDEQYATIDIYEYNMHQLNTQLEKLQAQKNILESKITEYEAKVTVEENGVKEAAEQLSDANNHVEAYTGGNGTIPIPQNAPRSLLVITDEVDGSKYVKMPVNGIDPTSVELYDGIIDYTKKDHELDGAVKIEGGTYEFDSQANDLIKITHLPVKFDITKNGTTTTRYLGSSLWMTCTYSPEIYWNKIVRYWEQRNEEISNQLEKDRITLEQLKSLLDEKIDLIEQRTAKQKELRKEFEEMMGPALREGYWQPENYYDYGDKYLVNIKPSFSSSSSVLFKQDNLQYLIDSTAYDNNSKINYQIGDTEETYLIVKIACINNLSNEDNERLQYIYDHYNDEHFAFIYYDIHNLERYKTLIKNKLQSEHYLQTALRIIPIGGENCRFAYVKESSNNNNSNNDIYLALVIEASRNMDSEQLKFFNEDYPQDDPPIQNFEYSDYKSHIGVYTVNGTESDSKDFTIAFDKDNTIKISKNMYNITTAENDSETYVVSNDWREVYQRIIIDSLFLKTGKEFLQLRLKNKPLELYEDYNVYVELDLSNASQESSLEENIDIQRQKYIIDIKPTAFIAAESALDNILISYELSNANTLIYLDALQVSKENSKPKVSYTIKLSIYDPYIIHNIYKKLSKIVHINDIQLKFENVQGYISHIEMLLDKPQEDSIEIKNYKTKFEDLFSNIVAQTDAMQKKSASYDVASTAFSTDGTLTEETITKMLDEHPLIFKTYIDEHLIDNPVIRQTLTDVFTEAGSILGSAGSAITDIRALTTRNAGILSSFANDASKSLTQIRVNEHGIFIGSDQRISLFSSDLHTLNSGVSIDLDPKRLIIGASSNGSSTAAKFTDKYIVLAAANVINSSEDGTINLATTSVDGTIDGLIGAKFTSTSIGMATLSDIAGNNSKQTLNAVLMNDKGITLGSAIVEKKQQSEESEEESLESNGISESDESEESNESETNDITQQVTVNLNSPIEELRNYQATDASYVRISGTGVDICSGASINIYSGANISIGSGGELYVNTSNFIINSNAKLDNSIFELKKLNANNNYETALKYSISNGLEITGTITANKLYIIDNNTPTEATAWINAKVDPSAIWLGVKKATNSSDSQHTVAASYLSITDSNISILSGGDFTIESGGQLAVTSSNVIINTDAAENESIFQLKNISGSINYFDIKKTGQNTVTAELAGWSIADGILYSGASTNYVGLCSSNNVANYAIWAGQNTATNAPFAVMRNGQVYLNKLMVLDPDKTLPGDHVQKGDEWFTAIDFSRLNFDLLYGLYY